MAVPPHRPRPYVPPRLVRFEEDYISSVVYHGGRDFDCFDAAQTGSATGVKSSYFWFTSSFDNALFYEDGVIHEGRLKFDLAAIVDASESGEPARSICDDIFMDRYHAGKDLPTGFVLHGCHDGNRLSTIFAARFWHEDDEPAFRRTCKHIWRKSRFVKIEQPAITP